MPRLRPRPPWSAPGATVLRGRAAARPSAANRSEMPEAARPLLFLDFEASALHPESWPVEIGFAWLADGRVVVRSTLILPRRRWSMAHWCDGAERCHGIAAGDLRFGRPADLVAADTDAFAAFHIVSDNRRWDQLWLDRLRAGRPRLAVNPLRSVVAERLAGPAADAFALGLLRSRPPHRAGGDAARLARAWWAAEAATPLAA